MSCNHLSRGTDSVGQSPETWTYNFHLNLVDGRHVSGFLSFSQYSHSKTTNATLTQANAYDGLSHSHLVNFALSVPPTSHRPLDTAPDITNPSPLQWYSKPSPPSPPRGTYLFTSAFDSSHFDFLKADVEGESRMDPFIRDAMLEMLRAGKVLKPDIVMRNGDFGVYGKDGDGWKELRCGTLESVTRTEDTSDGKKVYKIIAHANHGSAGVELELIVPKGSVNYEMKGHPKDGSPSSQTFSFTPHCTISGSVRLDTMGFIAVESLSSTAWFTHYAPAPIRTSAERSKERTEPSWTTAELQLTDGWSIKLHTIFDDGLYDDTSTLRDSKAVLVNPNGEVCILGNDEFQFDRLESWSSMSTLNEYGTKWKLTVPMFEMELEVRASFDQQELESLSAGRGYWKGGVTVVGTMGCAKDAVEGVGFVESCPAQLITKFDRHLKRAARITTLEVSKIYPDSLRDAEHAMKALGFHSFDSTAPDSATANPSADSVPTLYNTSSTTPHPLRFTSDISLHTLHSTLFEPVRHLTTSTSAGKSWRSYLSMVCISALGVSPEPYRPLLAAIELVHTGTLIIDDIQDDSPIRRGVPAVHTVWGVAAAINAGEGAYFAFDTAVQRIHGLSAEKRLGLFEIFFEAMRFAHAGQALDIAGQQREILDGILRGEIEPGRLERAIISVHRLKTAVAAMNIAKMSALLAGANEVQTRALARHWEQIGIAFQIVDDVYDIRRGPGEGKTLPNGGSSNVRPILKRRGDDIRSGKITIPIAKAGTMMPLDEARWIWETVLSKPGDDDERTQEVIDKLEEHGVVERCVEEANRMIEESWPSVEGHLVDCQAKVYLNALCRYMGRYHSI